MVLSVRRGFLPSNGCCECWWLSLMVAASTVNQSQVPFSQHLMDMNLWNLCFQAFLVCFIRLWTNVDLRGISLFSHISKIYFLCKLAEKWKNLQGNILVSRTLFWLTCQQSSLSSHFYCFLVGYFQGHVLHSRFMCKAPGSWPWTNWPLRLSITNSTKNRKKWCC